MEVDLQREQLPQWDRPLQVFDQSWHPAPWGNETVAAAVWTRAISATAFMTGSQSRMHGNRTARRGGGGADPPKVVTPSHWAISTEQVHQMFYLFCSWAKLGL